jgi:hypothetical protein
MSRTWKKVSLHSGTLYSRGTEQFVERLVVHVTSLPLSVRLLVKITVREENHTDMSGRKRLRSDGTIGSIHKHKSLRMLISYE